MFPKININKEKMVIIYKLLADALFILSGFLLVTLVAESLIPGISASHSAFIKIISLMAIDISALYLVSKKITRKYPNDKLKTEMKKPTFFLMSVLVLLMVLGLWKLDASLIIVLAIFVILSGILIYKTLSEEE